jgi:hypothetical protein
MWEAFHFYCIIVAIVILAIISIPRSIPESMGAIILIIPGTGWSCIISLGQWFHIKISSSTNANSPQLYRPFVCSFTAEKIGLSLPHASTHCTAGNFYQGITISPPALIGEIYIGYYPVSCVNDYTDDNYMIWPLPYSIWCILIFLIGHGKK